MNTHHNGIYSHTSVDCWVDRKLIVFCMLMCTVESRLCSWFADLFRSAPYRMDTFSPHQEAAHNRHNRHRDKVACTCDCYTSAVCCKHDHNNNLSIRCSLSCMELFDSHVCSGKFAQFPRSMPCIRQNDTILHTRALCNSNLSHISDHT